jgi:WD40-like Beta Propeller Repeat
MSDPNWIRTRLVYICLALAAALAGAIGPRALLGAGDITPVYLPIVRIAHITDGLAIVFVSRQIPSHGSIYWDPPQDMPGVGPHSRFRVAAPGKLMVREPDGRLRTLIDGSQPTAASLNLIDVNAPDVSYDGTTIVFAGLKAGNYKLGDQAPDGWRLYTIKVNGSGLRQLTFSDQQLDLSQFGQASAGLETYADTDPAWLPDGRIVFSSTRWPSYAQYSGVRTSNLYVVRADGGGLRRITAERNGADRPLVDPLTGKIVYARWWRNHRFPINSMTTITDPNGGYKQKDGLTADRNNPVGGPTMFRNAWQAATINPDGTGLAMWAGALRDEDGNHVYGGAFASDGTLIANYFPMLNMTEAGGFGGIRSFRRGPGTSTPILGITRPSINYAHCPNSNDCSYGIFQGAYAADPDVLPSGRIIVSWAPDVNQDYGLYVVNADGSGLTKLYDNPGTTELRARLIRQRPLPAIIADTVTQTPSLLPPPSAGPYTQEGTFVFDDLNVYANGPVDADIVSAPAVGSADKIRFFIDQQRTSSGSFPNLDWPILLGELKIEADGSLREPSAPANVPLFEQIRSADGTVPLTGQPYTYGNGATHVAGMNFGRPGSVARCVGCHAGHSMIPVPASDAAAQWSNLAPGAQVAVSSSRDPNYDEGLIDRRVMKGEIWRYWTSSQSQSQNGQWVKLTFAVPISVRAVRLYNPRQGDEANSSIVVQSATVRLYSDAAGTVQVASKTVGPLSVLGTEVAFADVKARVVRVELNSVTGTFYGMHIASLAEVEVVARGEAGP